MATNLPEPLNLRERPHVAGLPVPANTKKDIHGVHDFAVIDYDRARKLAEKRRCAMCGKPMVGRIAFIGGDNGGQAYVDGPMHPTCAKFAKQVCPYLNGTKRSYRADVVNDKRHGIPLIPSSGDPSVMLITTAESYRIAPNGRSGVVYIPERNIKTEVAS